jgi:hypothetical protein
MTVIGPASTAPRHRGARYCVNLDGKSCTRPRQRKRQLRAFGQRQRGAAIKDLTALTQNPPT